MGRRGWLVVGVLLLAVLVGGVVAVAVVVPSGPRGVLAAVGSARTTPPSTVPTPSSPGPDDVPGQIAYALEAQARALVAGDRAAFLAAGGPGGGPVAAELNRRFDALRALGVTGYQQRILTSERRDSPTEHWYVLIATKYCLGPPACDYADVQVGSYWTPGPDGVRLTGLLKSPLFGGGPRPWEVSALHVRRGPRVIAASGPAYAGRLPDLSARAERAAAIADGFVVGSVNPPVYVVFFGSPAEAKEWFGDYGKEHTLGRAVRTGTVAIEVLVDVEGAGPDLDNVVMHELGHVATLRDLTQSQRPEGWLAEGVAEYIGNNGRPISQYQRRANVRRYLAQTTGSAHSILTGTFPQLGKETWKVDAAYGIGFYCVHRLIERFGRPAFLTFFAAAATGSVLGAGEKTFKLNWPDDVAEDCIAFARNAVR